MFFSICCCFVKKQMLPDALFFNGRIDSSSPEEGLVGLVGIVEEVIEFGFQKAFVPSVSVDSDKTAFATVNRRFCGGGYAVELDSRRSRLVAYDDDEAAMGCRVHLGCADG